MLIILQISDVSITLIAPNCPFGRAQVLIKAVLYIKNINSSADVILQEFCSSISKCCAFHLGGNFISLFLNDDVVSMYALTVSSIKDAIFSDCNCEEERKKERKKDRKKGRSTHGSNSLTA